MTPETTTVRTGRWNDPRFLWWLVPACAALLALRKPWALHTPQLWAEDGSIFLTQDEQMGLRALIEPYNGYLHLLPRLIAFIASRTADPAWWPAIYNGFSFVLSVGVFARLASPRVMLPAKPGLMLAFVLVVGTGEVLINVTNLQWFTAFFLLLQVFIARPTTTVQRLGDLAILLIVGLNGPFAIVFAPLVAWRTWRERNVDNFFTLAAFGACAAIQGWLVTHSGGGLSLHEGAEPFRPLMALSILGSRLVTWTFLGPGPVRAWPLVVHAIIGVVFIGALLGWALRPDPRRTVRGLLVAAFVLVTTACAYRVRADTWQDDNLVNGDRYFYISRVLLAWLVILEIAAAPRAIAFAARALCLAGVLTHAPRFILPAPPDYKWAEHCDPIRRGVPANIYTLPEGWWIEYPGATGKKVKAPAMLRFIWCAAGLALLLGVGRDAMLGLIPKARELPRFDGATGRPWVTGDFTTPYRDQVIAEGELPGAVQRTSSWQGTDRWQGRAESAWFKTSRSVIHIAVAGYPRHRGCSVVAEFRAANGSITRLDYPHSNPGEQWRAWEIDRPPGVVAVRVIAVDAAGDYTGWVAFSHPFRAWPKVLLVAFQHLQLYATVALALTLIWGPGLLWFPSGAAPEVRTLFLVGSGPLLLAAGGVGVWSLGGTIAPAISGSGAATALWVAVGIGAWRRGFTCDLPSALGRALAVSALVVVAVTAKSACSAGPAGELYRGTISRNLTVGDRMDSRYPFFVVQAAARNSGPAAPDTERHFQPWTFFSRGPLAGLAAIPIVMATGGRPPVELPEQPWRPFDPQGFAAYRVTMMTLAGGIIVATCGLLGLFVPPQWALAGAGLLALSPFGVHEVMFTWPKWVATAWLVASFSLAHTRRSFAAGLTLGVGFLFHPLVLLWAPWIGLWAWGRTGRELRPGATAAFQLGGGAALLVLPWMLAGVLTPHLPDTPFAGQGGFLRHGMLADREIATWATWWHSRWMNFANTFVPLHVYLSDDSFHHLRANSAYEPSGRLVKFAFVWWNTLPFGLGLGLWAAFLIALASGWRTLRATTWLLVIGPALLITANWGWDPLGLMRECGHPLFVACIALTCVVAARRDGRLGRCLAHRSVPWLQLPETLLMLWLTSLLNPQPWPVDFNQLDPLSLAINALALLAAAWVLFRARVAMAAPT